MSVLLVTLHIVVCIALIMIVLLQTGKGADMGAAFGGGSSQTLFGSTGASTFLTKATTVAAVIFMLTSLGLAYVSSHKMSTSIMTDIETEAPKEKPVETETPAGTPDVSGSVQDQDKSVKEVSSQVINIPVSQADEPSTQMVEIPMPQETPAAGSPDSEKTDSEKSEKTDSEDAGTE
ncbi:Protein-export membrane protein [Desulfonema limicola]|uniref:Protein-export membrane protein SecG n=1 Tax=Desulfonema limicola TaxID=45656 RepID=A0A975GEZ0_9BACT|nr:preprotein translocase subunit SecG [Desulfonema limicola]QTA78630.1 Protein-export membrane protein [Desulfonema limicola]